MLGDFSKTVFICSPYSAGNRSENRLLAVEYMRYAVSEGLAPIVPHLYLDAVLDDDIFTERELALRITELLCLITDYFWVCGDRISDGMEREICVRMERKPSGIYRVLRSGSGFVVSSGIEIAKGDD